MEEEAKELIKKKIKDMIIKQVVAFVLPLLPYILIAGGVIAMIAVILMPFMGIFGVPSGDDSNMTAAALNFETKLEERIDYWADREVEIDKGLMLAVIFYEEPIDESEVNCDAENIDNCISNERNYNLLANEINPLADNMVEQRTVYYCSSEVITKELDCEVDDKGNVTTNCKEVSKTTFAEPVVCGSSSDNCKNICTGAYKTSSKTNYYLTSEEKYITYLKEDFLPSKLARLGFEIPTDSALKEEFYNDVIDDIFSIKSALTDDNNLARFLGDPMYSYGEAGPIDSDILVQLGSPMGTQACRQTSCYGYYGVNNCATHNGVDIGANGGNPDLYSIFNGKVISISYGSGNCKPDFDATPKCAPGCAANIVLIEHTIVINGIPTKFYSRYVHLDSIAIGITVGTEVVKGQKIGVMGNTGCSTGTHLHFEIWNNERKRHNPEELLDYTGCNLISTCEEARIRCGS